jgi:hypothetical protein
MKMPVINENAIAELRALEDRMRFFARTGYPASNVVLKRWIAKLKEVITELEKENQ